MKTTLATLAAVLLLAGCAGSGSGTRYSVVPQVDVKVKGAKKAAQANYQKAPADAPVSGSGGSR